MLAIILIVPLILSSLSALVGAQRACNGYQELCSKRYSRIVNVGAHNSYAVSATSSSLAANQAFNITTQLRNGVRLLQSQVHLHNDELALCHTSCLLLNGGTLVKYLSEVKAWMDENPDDVVTLLFVNTEGLPMSSFAQAYTDSGLVDYAYTPAQTPIAYGSWPELGDLVSSGTRLVSFVAAGSDYTQAPYILDQFTHMWENPYNSLDATFPCTVDRVTGDPAGKMYLMNHYLDKETTIAGQTVPVPDTDNIEQTNSVESIGQDADNCVAQHSQNPTFILVDYYDRGNGSVFEAAAKLNGVIYKQVPIGNASISAPSKSSNPNVESFPLSAGTRSTTTIGLLAVSAGLALL